MTALEMKNMAEIIYESIASNDAYGYDAYEWSLILNDAQEQVISKLVVKGIEYDDFSKLIFSDKMKNAAATIAANTNFDNSYTITLTGLTLDNIWLILREIVNGNPKIKVVPVSSDYFNANIDNPFKKPTTKKFWRIFNNNSIVVTTPSSTSTPLTIYKMIYLEKPTPIIVPGIPEGETIDGTTITNTLKNSGQTCTYHNLIHKDIVREAAKLAKLYASDLQGWQAHLTELKN